MIIKLFLYIKNTLFFSTIIYISIISLINKINDITSINCNYTYLKEEESDNFSLSISKENIKRIFIENNSLKNLIYEFCLENLEKKYQLKKNMFMIINKKNFEYNILFNCQSLFYQEITACQLIYYDNYYDIYHAQLLIDDEISMKIKLLKTILDLLDNFNIRLIIPIYNLEKIDSYFILFQNTSNIKNNFNESDFKYFFYLINYLKNLNKYLKSNSFYSKLIYENKIAELNVSENNELHEKNYKKLNEKTEQIEQMFIYENNKNTMKYFTQKVSHASHEYLNLIHKNKKLEDKFTDNLNFIFTKNKTNHVAILSNEKIHLNNHTGSFYTSFAFFQEREGHVTFLLDNEKINYILPPEYNELLSHRDFFNTFDSDFKIKIIINNSNNSKSFFKIISYIAQAECIYFSLKNINNLNVIDNILNTLIQSEKKYYLFFTNIDTNSSILQKHIIYIYLNEIIKKNDIQIKIFFILNKENNFKLINNEVISMGKIITLDLLLIKNINPENLYLILKNYGNYILKKDYSIYIIEKIYKDYFSKKLNTDLYAFFDFFEKIIDFYLIENIKINNDDFFYINQASELEKEALKNIFLMEKIGHLYNFNNEKIAKLLNINKSTVSKYYQNNFFN